MGRLDDKVIIVTGSGQGIGEAYAHALVREGARVVVADIQGDKAEAVVAELEDAGGTALAVQFDVSRAADCERLAQETVDAYGRIDVLVNNAAIFSGTAMGPLDEITEEQWDRMMAVNAKGPFLMVRAVLPQMREQGGGRIVNVASSIPLIGPPLLLHYTASKGALWAMNRAMATELGEENILVTALSPGMCDSGALESVLPDPIMGDMFIEQQVIKESMKPDDVAPALVFLCSDESRWVVGQNLVVDGGFYFN